ncbi:MAG: hypothetical protein JWR21_2837 [Herminiimonas sp.]|nr:hypothetical protein [Herminiimonas sp.]
MDQDITGAQIRAARAYLKWTIADLAETAEVGISTIQQIEKSDGSAYIQSDQQWRTDARAEAVVAIRESLEFAGITFLDVVCNRTARRGPGIRGKFER